MSWWVLVLNRCSAGLAHHAQLAWRLAGLRSRTAQPEWQQLLRAGLMPQHILCSGLWRISAKNGIVQQEQVELLHHVGCSTVCLQRFLSRQVHGCCVCRLMLVTTWSLWTSMASGVALAGLCTPRSVAAAVDHQMV